MTTEHKRRLSLEKDFMNFKTNDLLYAFMRSLSTVKTEYENGKEIHREYLTHKNFRKHKKVIAGICGCTPRTIENHIKKMFEAGLLDEGLEIIEVNGVEYEYDVFWFPYDEKGTYKLVNKDFLRYLIDTRNAHAIRIYLYLLNKYEWKKDYIFTNRELKEALGYNPNSAVGTQNIIDSFAREGVIKYEKAWSQVETATGFATTERMKLKFVATKVSELRELQV